MGVKVNIDNIISDYKKNGGKTNFLESLKKVLRFASKDNRINSINHLAYLLATSKVESDYSLQRWEADYLCGKAGVRYSNKPCQSAINYYCSTQGGKQNYCDGKPLDKRGLPYFGRGLIQITWKENYKKYGDKIGVNIVDNPELVFEDKNSYDIAVEYLIDKRGSSKKSTFDWVDENNLTQARKSVNGGTKSLNLVNDVYGFWLYLLKKNNALIVDYNTSSKTRKIIGIGLSILTVGVTITLIYMYLRKKNKLPNFIKKK